MALRARQVSVNLPFNIGGITFIVDETQQRAAWSLYVELETRVAVQRLEDSDGLLREALDSLYKLFDITRSILKDAGPDVADGENSFGPIAIRVLNDGLRPFTSKWHPKLAAYEATRPPKVDELSHERAWVHYTEMRTELKALQDDIREYSTTLAIIAGARHEPPTD